MKWLSLKQNPPEGDEVVVLFFPRRHSDVEFPGLPVSCSNAAYARENAEQHGATHWCHLPPLPTDDKG